MAFRKTSVPVDATSGAFGDLNVAQTCGAAVLLGTGGAAALVGAAVLPGQVAVGLTFGGGCLALGEVERRTGSLLPFLDSKEARERNQARADKRNAAREAKADADFNKKLEVVA